VFELSLRIFFNVFGLFGRNFSFSVCINHKHHFSNSVLYIDCKFTGVSFINQLGLKKKIIISTKKCIHVFLMLFE